MQGIGENGRALAELDAALAVASGSTNHQVDHLRIAKAHAMQACGDLDDGIRFLQERRKLPEPSPVLLRALSHMLLDRAHRDSTGPPSKDVDEAADVLRDAISNEQDPQRDMSVYNLLAILDPTDRQNRVEVDDLLRRLFESPSYYRRQWYVKRAAALLAWIDLEEAFKAGDVETIQAKGREAARWYSRAIWTRPQLHIHWLHWSLPFFRIVRYQRSAILHANARDAHYYAGHPLRDHWHERQFQRVRRRLRRLGRRHVQRKEWSAAYALFDWTQVGRNDPLEIELDTWAACCLWNGGDQKGGETRWGTALSRNPAALVARADFARQLRALNLDPSVPGKEPLDDDDIVAFMTRHRQLWRNNKPLAGLRRTYPSGDPEFLLFNWLYRILNRFPWRRGRRRWRRPLLVLLLRWHRRRHPEDWRVHYMLGAHWLLTEDLERAERELRYANALVGGVDLEALARLVVVWAHKGDEQRVDDGLKKLRTEPTTTGEQPDNAELEVRYIVLLMPPLLEEPRLREGPGGMLLQRHMAKWFSDVDAGLRPERVAELMIRNFG